MRESHAEQIERVGWMSDPDQGCTWDLSENDRAAIKTILEERADLLSALKLIWSMFDDGRIVRNISNDHKPDWALKMLTFTRELQVAHSAILRAEGKQETPHASDCAHWVGEPCNCITGKIHL